MAIKAGNILTLGNGLTVLDRLQTVGPGALNIPVEKIYEVGNYESVATVRDVPDLSFNMESLDVSCEVEALATAQPLATTNVFDLGKCRPIDILSPFKRGKTSDQPFDIDGTVAIPFLTPESVSYRFGLRDNAAQTWTLRGDSIFYCPGNAYVETAVGSGTDGQDIVLTHPAGIYTDTSGPRRVLSVRVGGTRLTPGADYTLAPAVPDPVPDPADFVTTTVTIKKAVPATETIFVTYWADASATVDDYPQSVHEGPNIKPAAVKGKDIFVYFGGYDPADPDTNKIISVQSVNIDWRVTLEKDEELGNAYAVTQDYDVPEVSGTVNIKPRDVAELFDRIRQITGTAEKQAVGPNNAVEIETDIVITDGANGGVPLKRFHIEDARYTLPGYNAQVQQKLAMDLPFTSDSGKLLVYKGATPNP